MAEHPTPADADDDRKAKFDALRAEVAALRARLDEAVRLLESLTRAEAAVGTWEQARIQAFLSAALNKEETAGGRPVCEPGRMHR